MEELLRQKRAEIVDGWTKAALGAYPADAAAFYGSESDPFANPVGASVRAAIGPLFDALLSDSPAAAYVHHLDGIIRVRCVQDLPPSRAVSFVFLLKGVIRGVLSNTTADAASLASLMSFEARIDRMAACAFDVYAGYLRKIAEIKVREMKASVAALARMSAIAGEPPGAGPGIENSEEAGDR